MEGKVILYDSNNVKIGETFTRRARQLVKQQRASWIDGNQDAIRFAPDMENLDETEDIHEASLMHDIDINTDNELRKIARRRVLARNGFMIHRSVALAVSAFLIFVFMLTGRGYFWPIWPILALWLGVAIHGAVYRIVYSDSMENKVNLEYERLKHRQAYSGGEYRNY